MRVFGRAELRVVGFVLFLADCCRARDGQGTESALEGVRCSERRRVRGGRAVSRAFAEQEGRVGPRELLVFLTFSDLCVRAALLDVVVVVVVEHERARFGTRGRTVVEEDAVVKSVAMLDERVCALLDEYPCAWVCACPRPRPRPSPPPSPAPALEEEDDDAIEDAEGCCACFLRASESDLTG